MSAVTAAGPGLVRPADTTDSPRLEIEDLSVTFRRAGREVLAVRGVDLTVDAGETVVLLGESGSGKSVTARSVLRLHPGGTRTTGRVGLTGTDLLALPDRAMRAVRGARVAMVPQDPSGSLDPLRRIGAQLVEVLTVHGVLATVQARRDRAEELLAQVGMPDPARVMRARPHELSGGMRQRVAIAMAISCQPEVLLADEPTTALDVTVQSQILALLADLQRDLGMSILFVTHDVAVAQQIAHRVCVMYAGRIVESGPAHEVLGSPRHPYTVALLAARPGPGVPRGELRAIPGAPPAAGDTPVGCAFADRCEHTRPGCRTDIPALLPVASGHHAACPVIAPPIPTPSTEVPR